MIKCIKEQPLGYRRPIVHNVMYCDGCGRRIGWCVPHYYGKHYCEKCYKAHPESKKNVSSIN